MTAPEVLTAPFPAPRPSRRVRDYRTREATRRRRVRNRLRRYQGMMRIVAVLSVVVGLVMVYLVLMANLTGLNDGISQANHERAVLQEETMRLDDRIAQLQSRERLAAVAMRLRMGDPHVYAVVKVPDPPPRSAPISPGEALFKSVVGWLSAR